MPIYMYLTFQLGYPTGILLPPSSTSPNQSRKQFGRMRPYTVSKRCRSPHFNRRILIHIYLLRPASHGTFSSRQTTFWSNLLLFFALNLIHPPLWLPQVHSCREVCSGRTYFWGRLHWYFLDTCLNNPRFSSSHCQINNPPAQEHRSVRMLFLISY